METDQSFDFNMWNAGNSVKGEIKTCDSDGSTHSASAVQAGGESDELDKTIVAGMNIDHFLKFLGTWFLPPIHTPTMVAKIERKKPAKIAVSKRPCASASSTGSSSV